MCICNNNLDKKKLFSVHECIGGVVLRLKEENSVLQMQVSMTAMQKARSVLLVIGLLCLTCLVLGKFKKLRYVILRN